MDCLIIGGGPAGLTAAIYLARFRLLRGCTTDLTLITLDHPWQLPDEERATLTAAGIKLVEAPARELAIEGDGLAVRTAVG